MGTSYNNPKIVTDGLVLYLDAANKRSYPGSGTDWLDLSGNGNNASPRNGPTYDTGSLGSISFDGIDDYFYAGTSTGSLRQISNNFCYDHWFQPQTSHQIDSETTSDFPGTSGQKYLMFPTGRFDLPGSDSDVGISVGTNGISVYEHAHAYLPCLLAYQTTINSIVNVAINYVNKQPFLYLNGILVRTGLTSPKSACYVSPNFGGGTASYGAFKGNLYNCKIYNRSLSADEIKQNFNALRGRYGL